MISLEHLADGSVSARNFETLRRLVVDTGGESLGLRVGSETLTWPGGSADTGTVTVDHGLGKAPVALFTQSGTLTAHARPDPSSVTTVDFDVRARTVDASTPAAATTMTVYWLVIG